MRVSILLRSFLTAFVAIPLLAGPKPSLQFQASWSGLPDPGSVLTLRNSALSIDLESRERSDLRLLLDPRIYRDGALISLAPITMTLRAFETRKISLALPLDSLNLDSLQYSGKLVVHVKAFSTVSPVTDSITMPPLFFHQDQATLLIYRQQALRDRFLYGNFRKLPLNTTYAALEAGRALLQANIPRVHPVIARVAAAGTLPGPTFGVEGIRFCLAMPGIAYVDSSRGEDLGTFSLTVPMARNWVAVNQAGNPLFSGFLDAAGCTPSLPAAAHNLATTMAYSPIYLHTGSNIRGFLSDLNLGESWPSTMPLFFLNFNSGNAATVNVLADSSEYAQTIFAAATQGLERYPGGHTNALYEWQIREQGDNSGTLTDYAPEGHPRVNIKYSLSALQKFTVVHEYGHAVLVGKLNPPLSPADLDYSVTANEANQHAVQSKEWQLAAAIEGFAHFVSGVAWNDVYPNADGIFYSDAVYDLDVCGQFFENNWNAADFPGQGVEVDWAQFFWNYYTDVPLLAGVSSPTQTNLLSFWLAAHPWPKNEGFFAAFSAAVGALLPPLPALHHAWFLTVAGQAGIDH